MKDKKIIYFAILFFIICLGLLQFRAHYQKFNIKLKTKKKFTAIDSPYLRVYNSKDKKKFTDYYLLSEVYDLSILDQPVWGFCILKDDQNLKMMHYDNVINLKENNSPCFYLSKIKKYNSEVFNKTTIVGKLVAAVFLTFTFVILLSLFVYRKNKLLDKKNILYLSICLAFLLFWMSATYPGLGDYDTLSSLFKIKSFYIGHWFPAVYNIFYFSQLEIFNQIFIIPIFVNLYVLLALYLYNKFLRSISYKKFSYIYPVLFLMIPSVGFFFNIILRDVYSCLIHLFLALSIPYFYVKDRDLTDRKAYVFDYVLVFLACFAFSLRREAFVVAVTYMIIFLFVSKVLKKEKIKVFSFFIVIQLMFFALEYTFTPFNTKMKEAKMLTSLSHVISSIITKEYSTDSREKDRIVIEKYYDYDRLKEHHRDYDVYHANTGAINHPRNTNIDELYKLTFKLIFDNFNIFIKSRFKMMYHLFWANKNTILLPPNIGEVRESFKLKDWFNEHSFWKYNEMNLFQTLGLRIHRLQYTWSKFYTLFYNAVPSLLIILLSFIFMKKVPLTALSSLIVVSRLPVFFLVLPAAQFKYTFDIFIFGWLILPFLIWEWRFKNK